MMDTGKAGRLQTVSVGLLILLLGILLSIGLGKQLTAPGGPIPDEGFAPMGWKPTLPTAALVFTSYLGFIQITTVAGDVKKPGKNLPLSLLGSIVIVGILYILTVFITTSLFEAERLRDLGETALTEVAREVLGGPGALIVFGGGLLATLSSSNASILASSRAVLALGRDPVLPSGAGRVNARFGTPHTAVALTGLPIAGLVLVGPLEVLAEVASSLHLLMYGLIAFSVIILRRKAESTYRPTFRTPGYPLVPLAGGLSSLALIGWMQKTSLLVAAGVVVGSLVWHLTYVRNRASDE
jgi:amino acid transporter